MAEKSEGREQLEVIIAHVRLSLLVEGSVLNLEREDRDRVLRLVDSFRKAANGTKRPRAPRKAKNDTDARIAAGETAA